MTIVTWKRSKMGPKKTRALDEGFSQLNIGEFVVHIEQVYFCFLYIHQAFTAYHC